MVPGWSIAVYLLGWFLYIGTINKCWLIIARRKKIFILDAHVIKFKMSKSIATAFIFVPLVCVNLQHFTTEFIDVNKKIIIVKYFHTDARLFLSIS